MDIIGRSDILITSGVERKIPDFDFNFWTIILHIQPACISGVTIHVVRRVRPLCNIGRRRGGLWLPADATWLLCTETDGSTSVSVPWQAVGGVRGWQGLERVVRASTHIARATTSCERKDRTNEQMSETSSFVRDICQRISVNIMSRARSTACYDFGTFIGLHDQRSLEWPFKSVLSNNQSQCREYRIREWFLTNFAE